MFAEQIKLINEIKNEVGATIYFKGKSRLCVFKVGTLDHCCF